MLAQAAGVNLSGIGAATQPQLDEMVTYWAWIQWYNAERPHQALGYASLYQYHEAQRAKAA